MNHTWLVAAENGALPGGKVGGVGDVVRDLPLALSALGLQVRALPSWLGVSLVLAVTVAILGSLLPAWIASRFDPSSNMQEI